MAEKKVQKAAAAVEDENHIIAERRAKLAKWRETASRSAALSSPSGVKRAMHTRMTL